MHHGALRALEFERIVEAVCRFAQTPLGAARLARLQPQHDLRAVASSLAATAETVRFLADNHVGLQAPADLEAILVGLAVEGRAIEPAQLLGLASFLASVDATCGAIRRARAACPILRSIADDTAAFESEIGSIRRKIDPSGEVVDDASADLKSIRDRLRKQRARLRGTLESYLRGKDTSKYPSSRSSPTGTDGMCWSCAASIAAPSLASSMGAPAAAPACSSNRSARSRSTTTSSRSSSRKPKKSTASWSNCRTSSGDAPGISSGR
jgi:dsDNA-specific endonuclease/ATPase MutS2